MSNTINEEDRKAIEAASDNFSDYNNSSKDFAAGAEWGIEYARKEIAELKAENENLKEALQLLPDGKTILNQGQRIKELELQLTQLSELKAQNERLTARPGMIVALEQYQKENGDQAETIAELKAENTKWREGFEGLAREIKQMQLDHSTAQEGWKMHYDSLKAENERITSTLKLADRNNELLRGHRDELEETLKRYKEALEYLVDQTFDEKSKRIAQSALSDTKQSPPSDDSIPEDYYIK